MKKKEQLQTTDQPTGEAAPAAPGKDRSAFIGSMTGTFEILGDIVSPPGDEQDWEVLLD